MNMFEQASSRSIYYGRITALSATPSYPACRYKHDLSSGFLDLEPRRPTLGTPSREHPVCNVLEVEFIGCILPLP